MEPKNEPFARVVFQELRSAASSWNPADLRLDRTCGPPNWACANVLWPLTSRAPDSLFWTLGTVAELRLRRTRWMHLFLITFPPLPKLPVPGSPAHPITTPIPPASRRTHWRLSSVFVLGRLVHKLSFCCKLWGFSGLVCWAWKQYEPGSAVGWSLVWTS